MPMDDAKKAEIFSKIRTLLLQYQPPYKAREGGVKNKLSLELWAEGEYEVFGRKRTEVYFAGLIAQKGYVGFYFMPVYSDEAAMKAIFSERLLRLLKGKSCFHIKDLDEQLEKDIANALEAGFQLYKQHGWV